MREETRREVRMHRVGEEGIREGRRKRVGEEGDQKGGGEEGD